MCLVFEDETSLGIWPWIFFSSSYDLDSFIWWPESCDRFDAFSSKILVWEIKAKWFGFGVRFITMIA